MVRKLLDVLRCPRCQGVLSCEAEDAAAGGDIVRGVLHCPGCAQRYPIVNGVPRFVPAENYAASFGLQWNRFRLEQLDSANRTRLSEQRFYTETGWSAEWMRGRWIVEGGCGAGRFLEVVARTGAEVIGMDLSNAVDAARASLGDRENVHLVQASIYELPFARGAIDGVYSLGVLQHTPSPSACVPALAALLKAEGRLAVTVYERKPWTKLNAKYLVRPLTSRLPSRALLLAIKVLMPLLFPLTEILLRLPLLGRGFSFLLPVANYVENRQLSLRDRYRWAVLDTFDMLAPRYDAPISEPELRAWFAAAGLAAPRRLATSGLTLAAEKAAGHLAEA